MKYWQVFVDDGQEVLAMRRWLCTASTLTPILWGYHPVRCVEVFSEPIWSWARLEETMQMKTYWSLTLGKAGTRWTPWLLPSLHCSLRLFSLFVVEISPISDHYQPSPLTDPHHPWPKSSPFWERIHSKRLVQTISLIHTASALHRSQPSLDHCQPWAPRCSSHWRTSMRSCLPSVYVLCHFKIIFMWRLGGSVG